MEEFADLLRELLVMEHEKTAEEADKLVAENPNIVVKGILSNNLRATAMALEMINS